MQRLDLLFPYFSFYYFKQNFNKMFECLNFLTIKINTHFKRNLTLDQIFLRIPYCKRFCSKFSFFFSSCFIIFNNINLNQRSV